MQKNAAVSSRVHGGRWTEFAGRFMIPLIDPKTEYVDLNTATPPLSEPRCLVGDIGGTHVRFGISAADGRVDRVRVLRCAEFSGPVEALHHYQQLEGLRLPRIACFGIANPVTGDDVAMTNHHWHFSVDALRRAFGLQRLLLVNDFTALALSLPLLRLDQRHVLGGGAALAGQAIGLIGPGTGLGVSGLVPVAHGYVPLQSEGGHVTLAARTRREAELLDGFRQRYDHVSAERVLSGPGLVVLHDVVRAIERQPPAPLSSAEISARAIANACPYCVEALHHFCALLGTVAGDLALTIGARGGVYLGGGIIPQLGDFFAHSAFRQRFEDKGRFSAYLARVPTFVIDAPYAALSGAAAALKSPVRVGFDAVEQAQ